MDTIRSICVYCGRARRRSAFGEAADAWRATFASGIAASPAASTASWAVARGSCVGGSATGIIPKFLAMREHGPAGGATRSSSTTCISASNRCSIAPTFSSRFPAEWARGEELRRATTWVQLQRHRKPVLLADFGGFWRPRWRFRRVCARAFVREGFEVRYLVAEKIDGRFADAVAAAQCAPRPRRRELPPASRSSFRRPLMSLSCRQRGVEGARVPNGGMRHVWER